METNSSSNSGSPKSRSRSRGPGTSHRFAYLVVGLIVLGVLGFFVGRPLYRAVKAKRAVLLTKEVNRLAKENNWEEALKSMGTAAGLAPLEPEVLRTSARLSARIGSPSGLVNWQALLRMPAATWEDRLDYLRMALDFNRLDLTGVEIAGILKTNRTDPAFLKLLIRHLRQVGKPDNAILTARQWLATQPTDSEAQFNLGMLLASSGIPEERAEGQRLLMTLAVGKVPERNDAVDVLARMPELPRGESQLLLKVLAERTNTQLAIANLQLRLDPSSHERIVGEVLGLARNTTNQVELIRFAQWLTEKGEVKRVPDLLPEDKVLDRPELLSTRLEALIEADRVSEVMPYLQMANPPVEPYMQHCLNALAAQKQGKNFLVRTYFDSALAAAGNSPQRLRFIAAYAEKMDQPLAAVAAYQRLMQYPPMTVEAGRQIIRLVGPLNDIHTIRDTLKKLAAFLPADESLYLNAAYAEFLLGESSPDVRKALTKRSKKKPDESLYPLVLSLGQLKAGNNAEALTLIESAKMDWDRTEPRWLALYAAILGANQQREAARVMAAKVNQSALKPPELELLKPWLPQ